MGGLVDAGEHAWRRSKAAQGLLNDVLSDQTGWIGEPVAHILGGLSRTVGGVLEFGILGPLQVVAGGEPLGLGSAQQRAVLALLVVRAPEPVSRDRLIDELWGERPPASAAHAVQVFVSGIRKILRTGQEQALELRGSTAGYALDVDLELIDAQRFERLIGEAQHLLADDPKAARGLYEEALGLWRGPPLADLREFDFAGREADRLEELYAASVEGGVEARLAVGEHNQVIGLITTLVATNPLRERPRRLLMLALYRCGRHAEALAAYRDAVAALDEIGLEPSPELRALEQAILQHDPSLAAPQQDGALEPTLAAAAVPASEAGGAAVEAAAAVVSPEEHQEQSAPVRRRKMVTALFCDVTGSTALGEELDPEALVDVMNRYFAEIRVVIERHGGIIEKFIGDAVMAVFGIPQAREDDALRAVRAAAEIRGRLPTVAEEVGVALTFRTAVNTGVVLVSEGENLAIGDAVNVAARLEQAATPGEILLGEETLRLVRDAVKVEPLEPLVLKGKSAPVRAFRLVDLDPLAPGLARHLDAPLVGREREFGLLSAAWGRVVEESGCHLFTLLGIAGVGKSRLVAELLTSVGDGATVLSGRCLHYGEGITFWPILEALSAVSEPAQSVLEHLGGGGLAVPEELFFEVRQLLERLALERPIILHVDDLQWAQPMLFDLLDHIVELSRGVPILLLCTARPDLLEVRQAWGGGKLNATTALLEPLPEADCEVLLDQLGDGLAPAARARVIAASDGNPLFLEEMVALAHERGTVTVPPTIQALLAARLEQLALGERELLERGAIEGEVFHLAAVRALAGERFETELEVRLAGLVRKELIRPHPPTFPDDHAFRFRHMLIRDATYDSLPKATRAELHVRFASWLEENARDLRELDEISGWHLEQAIRYRRDLGREADPSLAQRAAEHLHAAGGRASERGDVAATINLLERALACAPDGGVLKATASVDLADCLLDLGDLARVDELLSTAEHEPQVANVAQLTRFEWLLHAEPHGATSVIEARLPQLVERFAQARDVRALARAHKVASAVHWLATKAIAAGEELRLVADYARMAGDGGMRSRALAQYVLMLIYGPQDSVAVASELEMIEGEDVGPYLSAFLDLGRGELERLEGNFDGARRFTRGAIEALGALGMGAAQGGLEQDLGQVELSAGDPSGARAALMRSDAIFAELGERALRSTTQALLADAHERLGDRSAAQAAIELSVELSADEDVLNFALTHQIRARLALADGDGAAAERWATSAVRYWCRTDFIRHLARARLDLARVLSARPEEASAEAQRALELYAAKGDRPGLADAQAFLDQLASRA